MNNTTINSACAEEYNFTRHSSYYQYFVNRSVGHVILLECFAVLGLIVALVGYRFLKLAMFFAGFILAFAAFYVFSPKFIDSKYCCTKRGNSEVHIAASAAVGLFIGTWVTRLYRIGVFIIGKCLGLLLALLLLQSPIGLYVTSFAAVGSFLASSAILFGSLTCRYEKSFGILSTSFIGSYMTLCGIDVFLRSSFWFSIYAILTYIKENVSFEKQSAQLSGNHSRFALNIEKCWNSRSSMIMFSTWIFLSLLCCLFQYRVSARNLSEGGDVCPGSLCGCISCCCGRKSEDSMSKGKGKV